MKTADKAEPNEHLRQAREEKNWSQYEVADKIGCDFQNVSRWERGITFPSPYYRQKLCELFGKSEEGLGFFKQPILKRASQKKHSVPQLSPTIPSEDLEKQLNRILGREREIGKILRFLQNDKRPLVTISGTGGVGKTRLALAIEEKLEKKDSGYICTYVSLAYLPNNSNILPSIGQQLRLSQPVTLEKVIATVKGIPTDCVLIVLDNFEQVNTPENRDVLVNLLIGCKNKLQLLVTSRIALKTQYEQVVRLRSLKVPKLEDIKEVNDLIRYPATELYLRRAKNIKYEYQPTEAEVPFIVNVCRLLDGLPLGIELVASRIETHPPEKLYQALLRDVLGLKNIYYSNVPERHITLYETFEWTYNLLSDEAQKLFRRLAVFLGSCRIDTAATICKLNDDLPSLTQEGTNFFDIISKLSDHSLITLNNERIMLTLNTVRMFAWQKLCQKKAELEKIIDQFVRYYHALVCNYMISKYEEKKKQETLELIHPVLLGELKIGETKNFEIAYEYISQRLADIDDDLYYIGDKYFLVDHMWANFFFEELVPAGAEVLPPNAIVTYIKSILSMAWSKRTF